MLAVTWPEVVVTLHILAVMTAFGGALAYPLWFRLIRDGTPEQRAFFHRSQAQLGKFLMMPAILVIFATGAYLAGDLDVWDQGWVQIPVGILVLTVLLGAVVLGPSENRLSRYAEQDDRRAYDAAFRSVKLFTWLLIALLATATFLMVARVPSDSDGAGSGAAASRGLATAKQAGCLSCHRIGSEGVGIPGGNLSNVGARLTASEIRRRLLNPPPGMPSFENLSAEKRDVLVSYLAGLR